jgi:uncharacterized membrane protein
MKAKFLVLFAALIVAIVLVAFLAPITARAGGAWGGHVGGPGGAWAGHGGHWAGKSWGARGWRGGFGGGGFVGFPIGTNCTMMRQYDTRDGSRWHYIPVC